MRQAISTAWVRVKGNAFLPLSSPRSRCLAGVLCPKLGNVAQMSRKISQVFIFSLPRFFYLKKNAMCFSCPLEESQHFDFGVGRCPWHFLNPIVRPTISYTDMDIFGSWSRNPVQMGASTGADLPHVSHWVSNLFQWLYLDLIVFQWCFWGTFRSWV